MATPLETFFGLAWTAFLDGGCFADSDLQDAIAKAGLAYWSEATRLDVSDDVNIGEPILVLTDAGRKAVNNARAAGRGMTP